VGDRQLRRVLRSGLAAGFNAMPAALRAQVTRANRVRPGNRVVWGSLRRTRPVSDHFGYDRGTPVDRPLIEGFLARHRSLVRGRVLEVKAPDYTRRYGGAAVTSEVVVDIDPTNAAATLVADLCEPGSLDALTVDCVILTQTLQFLTSPDAALRNVWACLAPGGSLLVTAPCTSGVDPWLGDHDFWRFTANGLRVLLEQCCPGAEIATEPLGNVLLCVGFLYGLAAEELDESEYAVSDPNFALTVGAVVTRAPAA